jgi:predicted enzyme related to lactoylglutathione lyase
VPYSILKRDGKRAAALYEMAPEQGAFPYWASYVRVTDVQASAEQAVELGGRLVMPAVDVMQLGRMAFIQDPTGAVLGLWEPGSLFGAELDNTYGARSWSELQTRNTKAASRFYQDLFGWTARTSKSLMDGRYTLFELDGKEVGGMIELDAEWGSMPPNWSIYFGVEDCDRALATAKRLGGSIVMDPKEVENVGRFAFLGDPQGAIFAVIQFGHP